MRLGIEGRSALVAASSRGLGRAVAEELATEGADLTICARGRDELEAAREQLEEAHEVDVAAVAADLSTPEGVRRVVETALEAHGGVDILLTNTGGPPPGSFESLPVEAWREAYRNNLEGVVRLIRGVLPGMKERRWGRIVNVTSIAVKQPVDGLILSNSLRAAVTGLAKTLSAEVAPHGITVNNVMPGYTRTDRVESLARETAEEEGITPDQALGRWEAQIPAGRLGQPHEFAAMVAFLASDRAAYVTGTSIPVDGGWIRSLI